MRTARALAGATALLLLLAGCASDPLAEAYREGSNKNYISGDGSLTTIAEADRTEAPEWTSLTIDGEDVSSEASVGQVVVLNYWYAACPPCREEAPTLEDVHQSFLDSGVTFLGVNVRDQAATAKNFEKEYGITYPSVIDTNTGEMLLAFSGTVAPNAVPTTLVLDKQGRVAARFLGAIDGPSSLRTIINDTLAESD